MRLSLSLLSSLALVGCMSAQVSLRAGGPPPECTVTASQDTICSGESVTLSTTTNMTGIPSSGSLPFVPGGGVTDIEGNSYTSALIGTQEWMTQNLRTMTYANGEPIPYVPLDLVEHTYIQCIFEGMVQDCWYSTDTSNWGLLETGAYCHVNNDPLADPLAGKNYHGLTFLDGRGLCPEGWHSPSGDEFVQLFNHLGFIPSVGSEFYGPEVLDQLLLSGSNTSGFSVVLAGAQHDVLADGPRYWKADATVFGTSTIYSIWPSNPLYAYPGVLMDQLALTETPSDNFSTEVYRGGYWAWHTLSCRCVKDQEGTGDLQYLWNTGATAAFISEILTQTTTYTVNISNGVDSCIDSITITVSNVPEPIVIFDGSNLYTTETGTEYQWYFNGIAISGETSESLEPTQNGTFFVEVTNANGCVGASDPYLHLSTAVNDLEELRTRFYPNPSTGQFTLEINNVGTVTLQVTDLSGRIVYSKQLRSSSKISHHMVDLSGLAKGTYSLQVRSKGGDETQVVVIE